MRFVCRHYSSDFGNAQANSSSPALLKATQGEDRTRRDFPSVALRNSPLCPFLWCCPPIMAATGVNPVEDLGATHTEASFVNPRQYTIFTQSWVPANPVCVPSLACRLCFSASSSMHTNRTNCPSLGAEQRWFWSMDWASTLHATFPLCAIWCRTISPSTL